MAKVVVVFHSGYGHTQRMAQSVAAGANGELLAIDADGNLPEGGWETLAAADAIERRLHEERLGQGTEVSGAGPGPCRTGDVWLPRHGPAGSAASKPG